MNDQTIKGLMITVLYPAMIVAVAWVVLILQEQAHKYDRLSKKSFDHRIRK